MNSAEYFDPKTNQWTMIAPMRHRRSGVGVIGYHQCIYALFVLHTGSMFDIPRLSLLFQRRLQRLDANERRRKVQS